MKITMKINEFLKFYQTFVNCNGIKSFLYFKIEKKSLFFQSYDTQKFINIKTKAEVEAEEDQDYFGVKLIDLKNLIQKKYDQIIFETKNEGYIHSVEITQIKNGYPPIKILIAIETAKPKETNLFEAGVEYEKKLFGINNKEVKMEKYIDFCSSDFSRPMINCYILQDNDLICCTGHILAKVKNVCDVNYKGEAIHIPLVFTELIKDQNLKIEVDFNKQQTNWKIITLISDEIYIKYSDVERDLPISSIIYPQDDCVEVKMKDPIKIKDLKCFEVYKSKKFDGTIDTGFQISKNILKLKFLNEKNKETYELKEYFIDTEISNDLCFYFNWKYIKYLLKILDNQLKVFKLPKETGNTNKRLIVETDREIFLVMGKRL